MRIINFIKECAKDFGLIAFGLIVCALIGFILLILLLIINKQIFIVAMPLTFLLGMGTGWFIGYFTKNHSRG